jgi:hypothetical protein
MSVRFPYWQITYGLWRLYDGNLSGCDGARQVRWAIAIATVIGPIIFHKLNCVHFYYNIYLMIADYFWPGRFPLQSSEALARATPNTRADTGSG